MHEQTKQIGDSYNGSRAQEIQGQSCITGRKMTGEYTNPI